MLVHHRVLGDHNLLHHHHHQQQQERWRSIVVAIVSPVILSTLHIMHRKLKHHMVVCVWYVISESIFNPILTYWLVSYTGMIGDSSVQIPEEYQTNGHGGHEGHHENNHHNGKDESGDMLHKLNNTGPMSEALHELCVAFPTGFSHSPPSGGDEANVNNAPAAAAADGTEGTGSTSNRSLPSTPRPNGYDMAQKRSVVKSGVGGGGLADMNIMETVQQEQPDHAVSGKLARAGQEGNHSLVCSTPAVAHLKECKEEEPPASLSPTNLGGKSKCGRPRPVMGEYDQEQAANSSSPRQQSHILLTISTPPPSGMQFSALISDKVSMPINFFCDWHTKARSW